MQSGDGGGDVGADVQCHVSRCGVCVASVVLACVVVVAAALTATFVPMSFAYVEYDELALVRNVVTGKVDTTRVLEAGQHNVGLVSALERFPAYEQHFNESLVVFSVSGLEFTLELVVFYRLDAARLGDVYRAYGGAYATRLRDEVRTAVKNEAAMISIDQYLRERRAVAERLRAAVDVAARRMHFEVAPYRFLLHRLLFPPSTQQQYEQTAVQTLVNSKALLQRNVTLVEEETVRRVAEIDAEASYTNRTAVAAASGRVRAAQATAERLLQEAEGNGIQQVFAAVNVTAAASRRALLDLYALADNPTRAKVLVGAGFTTLVQT